MGEDASDVYYSLIFFLLKNAKSLSRPAIASQVPFLAGKNWFYASKLQKNYIKDLLKQNPIVDWVTVTFTHLKNGHTRFQKRWM